MNLKYKPELLAPAGDMEKLKLAFMYGADAVYASTADFAMRTREIGFDYNSLKEGINYTHSINKKIYITVNTFPHSSEIPNFIKHAKKLITLSPDAFIVADPGLVKYFIDNCNIPVHLSTQANITNYLASNFWQDQGVKRIVLARELNLKDIKLITQKTKIPIETFVHGAMCMAYSGRCQISNYLTGRDPNRGKCVQACRFKYKVFGLKEELRPNDNYEILEDDTGSYLFNSKDLCMINHIPELINAGVTSFKIEGRLKGIYYVTTVTRLYRQAIDLYFANPKKYLASKKYFSNEILKTSNRGYTTGFYFNKPDPSTNNYLTQKETSSYSFVGQVIYQDLKNKTISVLVKNQLKLGSILEIITPNKIIKHKLTKMEHKNKPASIVHAGYEITFKLTKKIPILSLIRTKI
ncbi:MAG: hypothetical protein ACD_58C00134G0001 [uncultured bacterium]|nr:MAG: hypothetical protein ACD_58C00134G0001 [uncultured bacterium]